MKNLLLLFFVAFSVNIFGQSEEYKAVAETVNYYLDGGTNNDYKTLIKAFHKKGKVLFLNDDKELDGKLASDFFGDMKPGPKSNRKTRIASINISGHAATAHLVIEFPDFEFNDYMTLLKIKGEWKIVTKIFYGEKK